MDRVRVRYVLTGACLPAYSGRVVHAIVAVKQPDGKPTTIHTLIEQFRANWPAEMKELADSIAVVPIKVLKTGRVLNDDEVFEQQLNALERETCYVSTDEKLGDHADELQKPSVVMHMVIQKNRAPPVEEKEKPKEKKNKSSNASDGGNSGEGREVKKDSCCSVM